MLSLFLVLGHLIACGEKTESSESDVTVTTEATAVDTLTMPEDQPSESSVVVTTDAAGVDQEQGSAESTPVTQEN